MFSLDTLEITNAQKVGSVGINVADFGLSGPISALRFTSQTGFNGPDWKFVGAAAHPNNPPASVPEPGTVAGLAAVSALFAAARRRNSKTR